MNARRTLWLYCLLAILGLAGWLISIVATGGPLRRESATASSTVKTHSNAADAQREKVLLLEEEQRAKRAGLSAEEAIRMSYKVQTEQELLQRIEGQRDAANEKYQLLTVAYQNHMKKLIPIIGLLILHLVGVMLFWPRPDERGPNKMERGSSDPHDAKRV
jgi:hypothetical protein